MDAVRAVLELLVPRPNGRARVGNEYPIVLVHGFGGWGRDEGLLLKYWGCLQGDIQEQLKAQGYIVYTATVGPFSSNWDRACELYAQIKGGTVDYGINHARTHGHARFGRTFTGLYPQWGDVVNGKVNKVHLIGHSMGGQTIRMLAQLLAKGSAGAPTVESTSTHPLFAGGKDWVHSITTISTPNQGTLLADGFAESGNLVKNFAIGVLATLGVMGNGLDLLYDAKLDHWGIEPKRAGETFSAYLDRVFASPIFKPGFRDISLWSLSTGGAAEESRWVQTLPNVYYFSYATVDTYSWRDLLLRKVALPNVFTMLLPMQPLGTFVGSRYGPNNGFSESWQANDGVVNTISMNKDAVGSAVTFSGISVRGKWNIMPQLTRLDHLAVVGVTLHTQIEGIYSAHAALLRGLPVSSTLVQIAAAPQATGIEAAIASITNVAATVNTKEDLQRLCATPINSYARNYCDNMLKSAQTARNLRGVAV